ncbi:hypothetical protein [Streptomyces sp. NPDC059176]|uniref:hypothetical protein n=1 Tax=Streptomyces sp. NPDC059176 TaxID=3346758 RepID=UPI0036CB2110
MNEIALPSHDEARALTDRIKIAVEGTWQLIREAYTSRTWAVLGYDTWDAYCTAEFGETRLKLPREERQEVVASLRDSGLSMRAIGAATGVSHTQISKDLKSAGVNPSGNAAGQGDSGFTPAAVTGLDGKSYAASRPATDPHVWAEPGADEVVDAELVDESTQRTYNPPPSPPQRVQSRPRVDVPRTVLVALSELRQVRDALQNLTSEQLARQDEETRRIWAARLSDDLEALHGFLDSLNKENNR